MDTLLSFWIWLTSLDGIHLTLVLIYGGLVAAVLVAIALTVCRVLRQRVRRRRVDRMLAEEHKRAYREWRGGHGDLLAALAAAEQDAEHLRELRHADTKLYNELSERLEAAEAGSKEPIA